ncbi:MAG: beta-ketoacyl-[acyl-carrier-protein] synthase II [Anaerolineales bacterium]|nr:MAG: beta-ketoacyl-[acyl-carrier-protein] synthase II [Anaerolineales bacterium]
MVTCLGSDKETFWNSILQGQSGIRKITQFDSSDLPCQIAGEIPDFDPSQYMPAKEARRISRSSQIGLTAAIKAMDDATLPQDNAEPERVGVYFGTAIGGWDRGMEGVYALREKGLSKVNPFVLPSTLANMPAFHVAKYFGAHGPNITISTACATGTQTVGEAAQAIRNGWADVIIAGATDALITDYIIGGFSAMRAIPTSFNDSPEQASRPFDEKREGFVYSEGSACLILESLDHAKNRGAMIYAEVAGYASSSDAFHIAAPDPGGEGAVRAMNLAIQNAGIHPGEIDYINAHGTSTPANDATETAAIKKLFGDHAYQIPISSTKSMVGHAMGASGAIEAIACALTLHNSAIHPTINYETPDPELDLDYVPNESRQVKVNTILSNSFGLGGQNACLVLKRWEH